MNSLDALRKMVDNYPGGRAAIALRLGKTDEVLRKELSGAQSHKLGVIDAESIADLCHDAQSAHCNALANTFASRSGGFVELPVRDMADKHDLRADTAGLLKEASDALGVITEALADEQISDNELKRIEREVAEVAEKAQAVLRDARERNAASRPALRVA